MTLLIASYSVQHEPSRPVLIFYSTVDVGHPAISHQALTDLQHHLPKAGIDPFMIHLPPKR